MSLVCLVYETWENVKMYSVITKVFVRLEHMIFLINEGDRVNDLVNIKRGKTNTKIKFDFKANNIKLGAVEDLLTLDKSDDNEIFTNI